ncbi:hypothetical protein [Pseudomonas sp. NPDC087626]|uniref:hypothetical protein n=1 Tax=Pseudomonas sp. NPDC087626 TaxID=3364444 RepID=UPI0038164816
MDVNNMHDIVSVMDFGAIGDGGYHPVSEWYTHGTSTYRGYANLAEVQADYPHVTSGEQSIDWAAAQAALNAAAISPRYIDLHDLKLVTSETLIWKGGAFLKGVPGRAVIKLMAGANCTILESDRFDYWAAWKNGSNLGYPMDGGIEGVILDGNAGEQGDVSNSLEDLVYGMRIHSHRFGIGWLQVRRIKGVGILTQYNTALMYSFRTDGVDDYGLQGSPLGSPSPYDFRQINVIDTLYEAFVFKGPADIPIWHLTTNYCGWLDNSTIPTVPRTSLLYPGEEIHSVRVQTACKIGYLNSNGALYGRSLYVAPFTRFHGDTIIVTGSWGALLMDGSAFGSIAALSIQQNAFAWGGVYKPGLEITFGNGSVINKNRFSFPQVSLRRLTTPANPNAIGPGIVDRAGAQFGIIDGIDSNSVAGHGLVIGATNRGGIYESVNFDSIQGTSHDGTESAAVMIEAGARDWRIAELRLTNCNRNLVNFGENMRGVVRDGTIEINQNLVTGQIALEGVVPASQLNSVVPGSGNIAIDNISSWGLEILDGTKRYYNRSKITVTFDGSIAGAHSTAEVPHAMWRKPHLRDVKQGLFWSGANWPNIHAGVRTLEAGSFSAAAFVHAIAPGTLTLTVDLG